MKPGHGEVLIRTKAVTICGSDIRCIYREHIGTGPEGYPPGIIAGHDPRDATSLQRPVPDYTRFLAGDLKGRRIGGGQVSEKHANFIVNRGDASAADVLALVDVIRETVHSRSGIWLELELQVFPLSGRERQAAAS